MSQASIQNNYASEIWDMISGGTVDPRMIVFGCGGAGSHIVSRLGESLQGVPRVAINTDKEGMGDLNVDRKICIGKTITHGGDSGGFTEVAEHCAELAEQEIRDCLISKDIVFVVTGLGGGTGPGISPYIAKLAKGLGLVSFGIAVLPFKAESVRRERAEDEVAALREVTESTIVLDNESLMRFGDDITLEHGLHVMDRMAVKIIEDVADRMSRSFMAAIADEILAYHSDAGDVHSPALIGYGQVGEPEGLVAGMNVPTPGVPTADHQLVDMGGMFQRI